MSYMVSHWVTMGILALSVAYAATHRAERKSEIFAMVLVVVAMLVLLIPVFSNSVFVGASVKKTAAATIDLGRSDQGYKHLWKHAHD